MAEKFRTFLGSYNYEGSQWGFELKARDFDDARARLARLSQWGKIDGELMFTIPARPGTRGILGVIVGIRNWLRA